MLKKVKKKIHTLFQLARGSESVGSRAKWLLRLASGQKADARVPEKNNVNDGESRLFVSFVLIFEYCCFVSVVKKQRGRYWE